MVGRVHAEDRVEGAAETEATVMERGAGDEVGADLARVGVEADGVDAVEVAPEVECRAATRADLEEALASSKVGGLADLSGEGLAGCVVGGGGPEAEVLPATRAPEQVGGDGEPVGLGVHALAALSGAGAGAPIRAAMPIAERTADSSSGTPAVA